MSAKKPITITDPVLAQRALDLVHAKLNVASQLKATRSWSCSEGHSGIKFFLEGAADGIAVTEDLRGWHQMSFYHDEKPSYDLTVEANMSLLEIDYAGKPEECPSIDERLALAESLAVSSFELVPYGYVSDGRITAFIYSGDSFVDTEATPQRNISGGLDCFVLEGEQFPEELKMPWPLSNSDVARWLEGFWQLVDQGKLVELTDRINNLPAEVWAISDGIGEPWMVFDESDGEMPEFVATKRYVLWHPTERFPSERFSEPRTVEPCKNALRNWFV